MQQLFANFLFSISRIFYIDFLSLSSGVCYAVCSPVKVYRLEPVSSAPTVAVWTAPPARTRSVLPQGTGARTVITAVSSFVTTCEPYDICVRIGVRSTGWGGSAPIS